MVFWSAGPLRLIAKINVSLATDLYRRKTHLDLYGTLKIAFNKFNVVVQFQLSLRVTCHLEIPPSSPLIRESSTVASTGLAFLIICPPQVYIHLSTLALTYTQLGLARPSYFYISSHSWSCCPVFSSVHFQGRSVSCHFENAKDNLGRERVTCVHPLHVRQTLPEVSQSLIIFLNMLKSN